MTILDVLHAPWAIEPAKLLEIRGIYMAHARGEKTDIAAVEQRLGRPMDNQAKSYSVHDGVAVLPLHGVIAKKMNMFAAISGGTSSELAAAALQAAVEDHAVHSIVLDIDSPGGTVDGTEALANAVHAARAVKPVAVLASGTMASAAYWIGSSAGPGQVFIADRTTQVGSIGVVVAHMDVSAAEAQRGVKTTEISAGKYKRIASQYAALTPEGRQSLQDQVDYTYGLFVDAVAVNRDVSADQVLANMADGRVFIGQQAVAAGLVDGITTLPALVQRLNAQRNAPTTSSQGASMPLTREQIAAEAPEILAALQAEGAGAERARIQAVENALIPGHEALIEGLKFDGKTSGGDAALLVNVAERQLRTRAAASLASEAPQPLPSAAAPAYTAPAAKPGAEPDDLHLPVAERCKARWEASADLQREFESLGAYTSFVKASERGVARIMNKQGA